jgi:hypothetical protein
VRNEEVEWHRKTPSSEDVEQLAVALENLARDIRGLQGRIIYAEAGLVRDANPIDIMVAGHENPIDIIRDETNTLDLHIEIQHRRS